MFKNLKWLRIVPDRKGKGGIKSGIHTFQGTPLNDTYQTVGFHLYRGRWRMDYAATAPAGTTADLGATDVLTIHPYVYPSTTDPSALPTVKYIGHTLSATNSRYWDFSANTLRDSHALAAVPATFLNISGRCFAADGAREGMIFDDRTPAIHPQANQNLGVAAPTKPLTLATIPSAQPWLRGTAYIHDGSTYLNSPDPNSRLGAAGAVLVGMTVQIVPDNPFDPWYVSVWPANNNFIWNNATPNAGVSSNTAPFAVAGTLSCVQGSSKVTLNGGVWPAGNQYAGLAVNFNGYSYVIKSTGPSPVDWDIDGTAAALLNTEASILGVYDGPTVTNIPYTVTGSQVNLGAGNWWNQTTGLYNGAAAFCSVQQSTAGFPPGGYDGYNQNTRSLLAKVSVLVWNGANQVPMGNMDFGDSVGATSWPVTYAYAWYDPETGHMSNISPTTTVQPGAAAAILGWRYRSVAFSVGVGDISYPSGVDATRFSHIVFFRTLAQPGASTLYPIGSLNPYVGKVHPGTTSTHGSWYPSMLRGWAGLPNDGMAAPLGYNTTLGTPPVWVDYSSDADLLTGGGFRAPQETNSKPMVTLRGGITQAANPAYMAYWDGRLWITPTQDPDVIMFSCDDAQCPLGLPVESFPPTNFLRIPSEDGQVLGMRKFGEMLLITTQRWAYTIAGNNETNYRLLRVSSTMAGVGNYQMAEMTADMEGATSTIYFLGRDKIVYQWIPGGTPIPISEPIQDILDGQLAAVSNYNRARVHTVNAFGRRLVILTVDATSPVPPLIYDIDRASWTQNPTDDGGTKTYPPKCYTSVYGTSTPVREFYGMYDPVATGVALREWLKPGGATNQSGYITTFPIDFDGVKKRKQIVMVNAHVAGGTGNDYTVSIRSNEGTTSSHAMHLYGAANSGTDAAYSVYTAGFSPVDSSAALDLVVMSSEVNTNYAPVWGYRFVIQLISSAASSPCEVYAIDIGYTDIEEPGDGDM